MSSILVFFHCPSNTGYAIAPLEKIFFQAAEVICGDWKKIHFAYTDLSAGRPQTLPDGFDQIIRFDSNSTDKSHGNGIRDYISQNNIKSILGFDQPVNRPMYKYLRQGGVNSFISYWGAPMSGLNTGLKLLIKKLDVARFRNGPDHYIFESFGMQEAAVKGRGVPLKKTSVIHLGVDNDKFCPNAEDASYIYDELSIDKRKKIFFYAGHMEERKGVHVLIGAMNELVGSGKRQDVHLVILGNRSGEEARFDRLMAGDEVRRAITFGGYRQDIPRLLRGAYAGLIASTGWDSFPRMAIEMASSGLPLLVSDLPGLREVVVPGETGDRFAIGDAKALASKMSTLLDDPSLAARWGRQARERALEEFNIDRQTGKLINTLRARIAQ